MNKLIEEEITRGQHLLLSQLPTVHQSLNIPPRKAPTTSPKFPPHNPLHTNAIPPQQHPVSTCFDIFVGLQVHLFDIDIPGKITFIESKTLTAGETPTVVDTDVGRIGIGICYDLRFQELAMIYAARGAHLICYPGAFNMTTGPLHWELLQRARAADNQLYVASCSPARDAGAGYVAWGHSTLVGPFGEVLATTEHEEAIIVAEIDYSIIELRRTNLPLLKQRRGDIYQLVDVQRLNSQ